MKHRSEPLVNTVIRFRSVFCQVGSDFSHESDGEFDGIVGGIFEEEEKDLEGEDFVCEILIDEVGDEG